MAQHPIDRVLQDSLEIHRMIRDLAAVFKWGDPPMVYSEEPVKTWLKAHSVPESFEGYSHHLQTENKWIAYEAVRASPLGEGWQVEFYSQNSHSEGGWRYGRIFSGGEVILVWKFALGENRVNRSLEEIRVRPGVSDERVLQLLADRVLSPACTPERHHYFVPVEEW